MDEDAIILLALGNQIITYAEYLKNPNLPQEEVMTAEYIIMRSEQIYDKLAEKISAEDNPTPRPSWKENKQ